MDEKTKTKNKLKSLFSFFELYLLIKIASDVKNILIKLHFYMLKLSEGLIVLVW